MYLHSVFVDPIMDDETITGVVIHNKSGMQRLTAKVVIDSTGDADVAARAGVTVHQDTPETALNATLMFRIASVDTDALCRRHPSRTPQDDSPRGSLFSDDPRPDA